MSKSKSLILIDKCRGQCDDCVLLKVKTRQNSALKDVLCDAGMKELFFKVLIDVYYYNFNVS